MKAPRGGPGGGSGSSYFRDLPRSAQVRGNSSRGEIEIVTAGLERSRIGRRHSAELEGDAYSGAKLGILLRDEMHLFVRDAVRFPSGATACSIRVISTSEYHGGSGVVILPVRSGHIVLRRMYRHATRAWEVEAPRGKLEEGRSPADTARMEIKQELGYPLRSLRRLGRVVPESAFLASVPELFIARLADGPRRDDPEDREALGAVVELTMRQVARAIKRGELRDGYTLTAILLAQVRGFLPSFG